MRVRLLYMLEAATKEEATQATERRWAEAYDQSDGHTFFEGKYLKSTSEIGEPKRVKQAKLRVDYWPS